MLFHLEKTELEKYLKYDLLKITQVPFLLTECKPLELNEFLSSYYLYSEQYHIFEMAKASVQAGNLQGCGSELSFATTPMVWIEWAVSKELGIPTAFQKPYKQYQKQLERERKENQKQEQTLPDPCVRSNETYRPEEENRDKFAVQQVLKVLRAFLPDLPIAQLIRVPPIKEIAFAYAPPTLKKWASEAGITSKQGNIKKEIKEKCILLMPKEWDFRWESDES